MDERLGVYLNSLEQELPHPLPAIEREDRDGGVPAIRKEEQAFLRSILLLHKPARILEVGSGAGFSALFMLEYAPSNVQITTIEQDAERIEKAKERFAAYGRGQITLLEGDASEILPGLLDPFDLIFLDAAKGQYPIFLPDLKKLLCPGGVLLADNVLLEGRLVSSRYVLTRRDRTTHDRMRAFLSDLTQDPSFSTAVVPLGDGISMSVKKESHS